MKALWSFKDVWQPSVQALAPNIDFNNVEITACTPTVTLKFNNWKDAARMQTEFVDGYDICAANAQVEVFSLAFMGETQSIANFVGADIWQGLEMTCPSNWPFPNWVNDSIVDVQNFLITTVGIVSGPALDAIAAILGIFS